MAKCSACSVENEGWIPKDRLDTVTEQRRVAVEALATEKGTATANAAKLATAEATVAASAGLQSQVDALGAEKVTWTTEKGIMGAGVQSPEGLSVVSTLWAAIPEASRPEGGIGAWLKGDTAPLAVKAYLPADTAAVPLAVVPDLPAATPKPAGLPNANAGAVPGSEGAAASFTAKTIGDMDSATYAAHRAAIRAERGLAPIESVQSGK